MDLWPAVLLQFTCDGPVSHLKMCGQSRWSPWKKVNVYQCQMRPNQRVDFSEMEEEESSPGKGRRRNGGVKVR